MEILTNEDSGLSAKGHYSPMVKSNGFLFISGQLPTDTSSDSTIETQTENVLLKLTKLLAIAGLNYQHIVKLTVYISDINDWPTINEKIAQHYPDHKPARSIVPVGILHHGYKIEIEAIAETICN